MTLKEPSLAVLGEEYKKQLQDREQEIGRLYMENRELRNRIQALESEYRNTTRTLSKFVQDRGGSEPKSLEDMIQTLNQLIPNNKPLQKEEDGTEH